MCSPRGWDSSHLPALCSGKRPGPGAALLPPGAPARGQKRSGDEDILLVSVPSLTSQGRREAMVCRGPWDVWNCSRGVGGVADIGKAQVQPWRSSRVPLPPLRCGGGTTKALSLRSGQIVPPTRASTAVLPSARGLLHSQGLGRAQGSSCFSPAG